MSSQNLNLDQLFLTAEEKVDVSDLNSIRDYYEAFGLGDIDGIDISYTSTSPARVAQLASLTLEVFNQMGIEVKDGGVNMVLEYTLKVINEDFRDVDYGSGEDIVRGDFDQYGIFDILIEMEYFISNSTIGIENDINQVIHVIEEATPGNFHGINERTYNIISGNDGDYASDDEIEAFENEFDFEIEDEEKESWSIPSNDVVFTTIENKTGQDKDDNKM